MTETVNRAIEQVRAYIGEVAARKPGSLSRDVGGWRFAATMPDDPHWYVVYPFAGGAAEQRCWQLFRDVITTFGVRRTRDGKRYLALRLDEFDYWCVWPCINRRPSVATEWAEERTTLHA